LRFAAKLKEITPKKGNGQGTDARLKGERRESQ